MSRRKTYPVQFEWNRPKNFEPATVKEMCWRLPFFYGDGERATEPSVILRRSDYNAMRRELRQLRQRRE